MRTRCILTVALILTSGLGGWVLACEWDYDTLLMERQRFPQVLELITGKFLRHSPELYQWRIEDRKQRLLTNPEDLRLYDDLAVAYDKTNQQGEAIKTIRKKEQIKPGIYETYANLGTFYIHSGQLEQGLEFLGKAIQVNPDAHFGRETYQQQLVEYVISKRNEGHVPQPLSVEPRESSPTVGFARFVLEQRRAKPGDDQYSTEVALALKGVSGMLHFGQHDSPVLLEALGDLLLADVSGDAKQLAARAYLKAWYEVPDEEARQAYRRLAEGALNLQSRELSSSSQLPLEQLEADFQIELQEAEQWYEQVRQDELTWIKQGAEVDEEFTRKYYDQPQVTDASMRASGVDAAATPRLSWTNITIALALFLVVASLLVGYGVVLSQRG